MLRRTSLGCGLLVLLFVFAGSAEKKPSYDPSSVIEFPVSMQQKVTAGITPVGTKVQAKLTISTLVNGTVVPQDAMLSGEVTESQAKSGHEPSRLGIRMDSAQWKNGSLAVKLYLTEWYYPMKSMVEEENSGYSAIHGSVGASVGIGGSSYPSGNPYPGDSPNGRRGIPNDESATLPTGPDPNLTTARDVSNHRQRMKDVDLKRNDDGSIAISSKKANLKLDKYTTYVLAAGDLLPSK